MKLQIDTENKILRIEEKINLKEFIKILDSLFPNKAWKEYSLETTTISNWISPIYIKKPYVSPYNNPYPWWQNPPYVNCDLSSNTINQNNQLQSTFTNSSNNNDISTTYNVELNLN